MKTFTPKGISQVDLKISQDIKNHEDWMYEIGQSIRTLKEGLVDLANTHQKDISKVESDNKSVLIAFENLQEKVLKKLNDLSQRVGDLDTICMHIHLDIENKLHEFSKTYVKKEEVIKDSELILLNIKQLEEKNKIEKDYLETEFVKVRNLINDQIQNIGKQIPSIEEFKPLKNQMEEAFKIFKVDFDGLIKEISLLKKSVAYDQKKFENIYTLIERLKEGK